jgi:hypothetical protein
MLLLIGEQVDWLCRNLAEQLGQTEIAQRVADLLVHRVHVALLLESLLLCECFLEELHVDALVTTLSSENFGIERRFVVWRCRDFVYNEINEIVNCTKLNCRGSET